MIYPIHPVAKLFPPMSDDEYVRLKNSIRANGVLIPIVLYGGQVIDGVHRMNACEELGVDLPTTSYGGEPAGRQVAGLVSHVVGLNMDRRHLDVGQRGMVAARIADMAGGEGGPGRSRDLPGVSRQDAADMMKVGIATVGRARRVISKAEPAVVAAVEAGDLPLTRAAEISKLPADKQSAAISGVKIPKRPSNRTNPLAIIDRAAHALEGIAAALKSVPIKPLADVTAVGMALGQLATIGKVLRALKEASRVHTA